MKKILKILLRIIFVVIGLVASLYITSRLLEDKIINKAVGVINDQLEVPIYVQSIEFSLLKQFPNASLQLNNVTVLSSPNFNQSHFDMPSADTLLYFSELYLSVNLLALTKNKLDITKAYAKKGKVNFLVDGNGKQNFDIFQQKPIREKTDSSTNSLAFMLNQIQLKNIELRFINKYKNTSIGFHAPNYTVKGKFYKKNYAAQSKGELLLSLFKLGNINLNLSKPAVIQMKLAVNNNKITIDYGTIQSNIFDLKTNGSIVLNDPVMLDLKLTGNSTNIDALFQNANIKLLQGVKTKGSIGVSSIIKGQISSKVSPAIALNFRLQNGGVIFPKTNINLSSIEFSGSYSNGTKQNLQTSKVKINEFSIATDSSSISGALTLSNFLKPYITATIKPNVNLSTLDKLSAKNNLSGKIGGSINIKGYVNTNERWQTTISKCNKTGNLQLQNAEYYNTNQRLKIENVNGEIQISSSNIWFNNISSKIQSSSVKMNASIYNYNKILADSTYPININANIASNQLLYSDFEHLFNNNETSSRDINIACTFSSKRVEFKNLQASNAVAKLSYQSNNLKISSFSFNAFEGQVKGALNYLTKSSENNLFQSHVITNKVNISSLFKTFNNFNQKQLTYNNIGGFLTSDFDLEMLFKNGIVDTSSIEMLGHFVIEEGKLIHFKPINEVAKFSEIDELKNISFTKIENDILISKSTVNIPQMTLESNAFDIKLDGKQHFNGDYLYNLQLNLSDFIKGKSKRLSKLKSEFGVIADDGYGKRPVYLIASSRNGKSKVKLDRSRIKANLKSELKEEKKELKRVLHKQFGWFKNDSTIKEPKKEIQEPDFVIEWDEE